MTEQRHPNTKKVTAYNDKGEVHREFDSVKELAEYYNKVPQYVYNATAHPTRFYRYKEPDGTVVMLCLKTQRGKHGGSVKVKETEDEIRRRLGLNPYGEWRTDEWIYAMVDRVNKRLYPNGYDEHGEWLKTRNRDRFLRNKEKEEEGQWFDPNIDTRNLEL